MDTPLPKTSIRLLERSLQLVGMKSRVGWPRIEFGGPVSEIAPWLCRFPQIWHVVGVPVHTIRRVMFVQCPRVCVACPCEHVNTAGCGWRDIL
jgi:hypothetical protein